MFESVAVGLVVWDQPGKNTCSSLDQHLWFQDTAAIMVFYVINQRAGMHGYT